MSQISGAPQPLSSERLLQGFLLLNLRVTYVAEQMFFITSERSQLSFSGHSPWRTEQGWDLSFQRTGLWFCPEFMVLQPDSQQRWQELLGFVALCHPFPCLLSPPSGWRRIQGRDESSELPVPFAITSMQHGSLSRGVLATRFFDLLGESMAGPSRVVHGLGNVPGSCSSKWPFRFVPLAAPSYRFIWKCFTLTPALPLTSNFRILTAVDVCCILGLSWPKLFLPERVLWLEPEVWPTLRPSAPCPRHFHTPYPVLLCAKSIHGADCLYLPLGCLEESFPRVSESVLGISARVNWWPVVSACVASSPSGWATSF